MQRSQLTKKTRELLARSGFFTSEEYGLRGVSFDIIARRDNVLLVVKLLSNIDGFSGANADEMKMLARLLKGAPVVVGVRSSAGQLADGIIYLRHGVTILTYLTMKEYVEKAIPPFVFAAPGGLYAKIDPDVIKKARRERNLSLGALADIAGVSRKAIQMYEMGTMSATLPVIDRLEKYLGEPLVTALNPFTFNDRVEPVAESSDGVEVDSNMFRRGVFEKLEKLGYHVIPIRKCAFDAVSESHIKCNILLTGVGPANKACLQKAQVMANISRITEKEAVLFIDRRLTRENIGGMAIIGRDELKHIQDEDKIAQLIKSRSRGK